MKITSKQLCVCALCIAMGVLFPSLFHAAGLGSAFLPMHIPVFLCAFLCGGLLGTVCACASVLLCSVLTGMPPFLPTGVCMMVEMSVYALICAWFTKQNGYSLPKLYTALIAAIVCGRAVNGIVNVIVLGLSGKGYSLELFVSANLIATLPGTILLLALIPYLVKVLARFVCMPRHG